MAGSNLRRTRDCFLWFMSIVYLFAFSSLYIQIPGLYGDNGILPAKHVIKNVGSTWQDLMEGQPTLLKLMPRLGLDLQTGMDLLALSGMIISFFCVVSRTARDFVSFTLLWMFYLSLYQVGQTFMWFQWDILLLETGFLTIIIAPFNLQMFMRRWSSSNPHDGITMWLARWLLFRLMFASGVVKLTSKCATWWGLTALNVHFESQCIPTPAAWYWHHLPDWFLQLSTVFTYVIEMAVPFLFFMPMKCMRLIAFWSQVLLQMLIIITGNYNFFNFLTITICISLLDDSFCLFPQPSYRLKSKKQSGAWGLVRGLLENGLSLGVLGYLIYQTCVLFSLKVGSDFTIQSKVAFTESQFFQWLEKIMPYTIYMAVVSLALEILLSIIRSIKDERGMARKAFCMTGTVCFSMVAIFMFTISLVPHSYLDSKAYDSLPKYAKTWHTKVEPFQLSSSYGLFRTMTGVGGRPELILEGHPLERNAKDGWLPYEFLYKPGNLSVAPPVVAPHQPRLDWQMWFAALGNYQNNPWLLNTLYRLLQNEPDVLELLGPNPFPVHPPKYIRAILYHYHYTTPKDCEKQDKCDWWKREEKVEYLPPISMTDKSFIDYLKHFKFLDEDGKETKSDFNHPSWMSDWIKWTRLMIGQPEGFNFIVSVFGSSILAMFLNRAIF